MNGGNSMAGTTSADLGFVFDNSYALLPDRFFENRSPAPVADPQLIRVNHGLAEVLGLNPDALETPAGVNVLAGNSVPAGADPLAMAYAGHQFGGFVPQLGDGRAVLLGEIVGRDGRRDIQLKGAGRTAFSRMGDGRAAVGPVLREYVVSEAMHALGIPTTRSLAVVRTGEVVLRERPLPGAVLTRVAKSHIRVGTFQYFAARGDLEGLQTLTDYVIDRHYGHAAAAPVPALELLRSVIDAQAGLIARWMMIGFIHGVMNTDNMSVAGETIDYGPCAFMDTYDPATVYSSIDQMGRYAYGNQPAIGHWNLVQLAQCLLPLIDLDQDKAIKLAQETIDRYPDAFELALTQEMRRKLGLGNAEPEDRALCQALLDAMVENTADFTLTFRGLAGCLDDASVTTPHPRSLFTCPEAFDLWAVSYLERLSRDPLAVRNRVALLKAANPVYLPRNHLVEEVIRAAEDGADFAPFARLVDVLASPFDEQPGRERYAQPPRPEERVQQTFCGT